MTVIISPSHDTELSNIQIYSHKNLIQLEQSNIQVKMSYLYRSVELLT